MLLNNALPASELAPRVDADAAVHGAERSCTACAVAHAAPAAANHAAHAHKIHALVVGMHAVCCGGPILMAGLGVAAGAGAIVGFAANVHAVIHQYEWWLVALSGALVAIGAVFELRLRRDGVRRFPWLFAASCAAFLANAAIVAGHSAGHDHHAAHHVQPAAAIEAPAAVTAAAPAPVHDHHHDHAHAH